MKRTLWVATVFGVVILMVLCSVLITAGKVGVGKGKTGSLTVTSDPSGAYLYVDSTYQPVGLTPYTVQGLSVGNHKVWVTKPGYMEYITTLYINKGSNFLNVVLTPIPVNQTV